MAETADPTPYPCASLLLGPQLFVSHYKGVVEPKNALLALDRNGRPIPHTYLGRIEEVPRAFPPEALEHTQELESGFLFYATPWHHNYQHFLTETFPKVVDYLELIHGRGLDLPLLVPAFMMNGLVRDLMALLGLEARVLPLETPALYRVQTLYSSSYIPNYDPPTPKMAAAFRMLRDSARRAFPPAPGALGRRVYLARDKHSNQNRNNCNAGVRRVITNEDAVRERLSSFGFEDVFMGDLGIGGKVQALAGAEIIVSPIGANLMNLLFLTPPYPRRVVILHSSYLELHAGYFKELLDAVYGHRVAVELFQGPAEEPTENSPYALDPDDFGRVMHGLLAGWGPRMFPAGRPPDSPSSAGVSSAAASTDKRGAPVTAWVTLDPSSDHLRTHLEETIDALLDRGVEEVGFHGVPDALAKPGWEGVLWRFLETGFQCLLCTSFPEPLTPRQASLLSWMEEIWTARLKLSEPMLQLISSMAGEREMHPPRFVEARLPATPQNPAPPDHTRDCLDPWEGIVFGPSGETYPCAIDRYSLGDHRREPLPELLEALEARRRELLGGDLAPCCASCPRSAWIPVKGLQEKVARLVQRQPKRIPLPTSQELQELFGMWATEGRRVAIYPAGNHARWLLDYAPSLLSALAGFGDRDPAKQGTLILGRPVRTPDQILPSFADLVLIAVGSGEAEIHRALQAHLDPSIQIIPLSRLGRIWRRVKPGRLPSL